jgi:hypothetical protein
MNTMFKSVKSPHNVHTVKCIDCHTKEVARKMARVAQDRIASSAGFDTGGPNTAQDPLSALRSLALTTTQERMHLLLPYVSGFPLPSWPELLTGLT